MTTGSTLFLSFLLAFLVLKKIENTALYEKTIYLLFNTLIIFSLAVNTNFAGSKISGTSFDETINSMQQYSSGYNLKLSSESSYINGYKEVVATKPPLMDYQSDATIPSNSLPIKTKRNFFDPYF